MKKNLRQAVVNNLVRALEKAHERLTSINQDTDGDFYINESCDALVEIERALNDYHSGATHDH